MTPSRKQEREVGKKTKQKHVETVIICFKNRLKRILMCKKNKNIVCNTIGEKVL